MATVKTRVLSSGVATYRVVWRAGGSGQGAWESETFAGEGSEVQRYRIRR